MNFSQFFITRPVFAGVLSAMILIAGLISMPQLPISEYPEVVPPTVVVHTAYPGANPQVIADTVAGPLEQAITGVEDMLYQFSQATSDGVMTLTVTFKLGTDVDKAQVLVQNRVAQATPKLPQDVQRIGVTVNKATPDITLGVFLLSPDGRYDQNYLSNFAILHVKDELAKLDGVGDMQTCGGGNYSMRIWLDPEKVAARGLTAGDVANAIREQNVQVAAGQLGSAAVPANDESKPSFQIALNTKGRLIDEEDFRNIIVRTGSDGQITRLRDVARVELGSDNYALRAMLNNETAVGIGVFQRPGSNAIGISDAVRAKMAELKKGWPEGIDYNVAYDPTVFVRGSISAVLHTLRRGAGARRHRGHRVPADVARFDHSAARGAGVVDRHARRHASVRLRAQYAVAVRTRARDRHRRRRCDRRRRERRAKHHGRIESARGDRAGDERGHRPDRRDRAGALRRVRADGLHQRPLGSVLQAVRADDCDFDGDFGIQLADAVAGAVRVAAEGARRGARSFHAHPQRRVRLVLPPVQPLLCERVERIRARRRPRAARERDRAVRLRRPDRPHRVRLRARADRLRAGAGQAVPRRLRAASRRGDARPHLGRDPPHGRHRAEDARRAGRAGVPGPFDQRLHERVELRHRVHDRSSRSTSAATRRNRPAASRWR